MLNKLMLTIALVVSFHALPIFAEVDALDEVNRTRAAAGLAPFIRDTALSQAAAACAKYRAQNLIQGHVGGTRSDFAFLPPGAFAPSAGAGAWYPGEGWGTCCTYQNFRYAGAAYMIGADGRRYMQLFVSNSPNPEPAAAVKDSKPQSSETATTAENTKVKTVQAENGYYYTRGNSGWILWKDSKQAGWVSDNRTFHWLNSDGTLGAAQPVNEESLKKLEKIK